MDRGARVAHLDRGDAGGSSRCPGDRRAGCVGAPVAGVFPTRVGQGPGAAPGARPRKGSRPCRADPGSFAGVRERSRSAALRPPPPGSQPPHEVPLENPARRDAFPARWPWGSGRSRDVGILLPELFPHRLVSRSRAGQRAGSRSQPPCAVYVDGTIGRHDPLAESGSGRAHRVWGRSTIGGGSTLRWAYPSGRTRSILRCHPARATCPAEVGRRARPEVVTARRRVTATSQQSRPTLASSPRRRSPHDRPLVSPGTHRLARSRPPV